MCVIIFGVFSSWFCDSADDFSPEFNNLKNTFQGISHVWNTIVWTSFFFFSFLNLQYLSGSCQIALYKEETYREDRVWDDVLLLLYFIETLVSNQIPVMCTSLLTAIIYCLMTKHMLVLLLLKRAFLLECWCIPPLLNCIVLC